MFRASATFGPPRMVGPPRMFGGRGAAAPAGVESEWCVSFDGVDDYVSGSHSINLTATDISISGWVFFSRLDSGPNDSFANPRIIEIRDGSYSIQVIVDFTSGRWVTKHTLWQTSITGTQWNAPTAGAWVHIAAVFYTGTLSTKFFVNGVEQAGSANSNIGQGVGVNTFHIGTRSDMAWTTRFNGRIDDVRVYSRAIDATEVAALAANTSNITTGLTFHLPMEDGTGTTTVDSVGGVTCTLTNGPTWHPQTPPKLVSGRETSVRSLSFDGVDDCVVGQLGSLLTTHAISCWVNTTATTNSVGFVSLYQSSGTKISQIGLRTGGKFWMQVYSGGSQKNYITNTAINDGIWHHLCGVFDRDADTIRLYIDGDLSSITAPQDQSLTSFAFTPGSLKIGTEWSGTIFLSGKIDDPRIFSRALSAAEVHKLCRGQNPTTNDPVGWWKGDETSGTLVEDFGSGGNDGTCVGGVTRSTDVSPWLAL